MWDLLRLDLARFQARALNAMNGRDPATRWWFIRWLATLVAIGALLAWAVRQIAQPGPSDGLGLDVRETLLVSATNLLVLLFIDGIRRGSVQPVRRARGGIAWQWWVVAGAPPGFLILRGILHAFAATLLVSWIPLLPLSPAISGMGVGPRLSGLLFVLAVGMLGDAVGRVWQHWPGALRAAASAGLVVLWALLLGIGSRGTLSGDPSWAVLMWTVFLDPGMGCVYAAGTLAAAAGLAAVAQRWSMERAISTGPARRAAEIRVASRRVIEPGEFNRGGPFRHLLRRRRRGLASWVAADPLAPIAVCLLGGGAYIALLAGLEGARPLFTLRAVPWTSLFAVAFPVIALSEATWAHEPRALQAWVRVSTQSPWLLPLSHLAVSLLVLLAWVSTLSVSCLVGTRDPGIAGTHFVLASSYALAGASAVVAATVITIRGDYQSSLPGRIARYMGAVGGLCTPAIVVGTSGSEFVGLLSASLLGVIAVGLCVWHATRSQFYLSPSGSD